MRRVLLAVTILLVVPGVAYAGGGGVDTSGCSGYSEGTIVSMRDSCFAGTAHFTPSDSTITVSNDGALPHTFTAVDGSFDTGQVAPGASAQLTFDQPGIYRVFCSLHGTASGEGMAGVVLVGEAVPASVISPMDTTAIADAVARETSAVVDAVERQQTSIRGLSAIQARLLTALETGPEEPASPQVVTVPSENSTERAVLMLGVGLAIGLALAALLTARRVRRADAKSSLERLEPSAES
ncbi:MAG: cupredoxin domain-containing protein [Acidimicrobiia bacterium]